MHCIIGTVEFHVNIISLIFFFFFTSFQNQSKRMIVIVCLKVEFDFFARLRMESLERILQWLNGTVAKRRNRLYSFWWLDESWQNGRRWDYCRNVFAEVRLNLNFNLIIQLTIPRDFQTDKIISRWDFRFMLKNKHYLYNILLTVKS